ncbi:hypothetical protein [Rhizobium leguminosarum]|uniref:N-acetylmuramoyl-L-alanine amidase CwlA n=1 Tax=Rhizobium leguminosarum TaxID=384 RepID=A0A7X0DQN8_RHILE|nr:hypothetical protein [Rhizobium leguminosarum]MBB6219490.1 N-acetylmuramoyl-L-alanine amidase CwlA [Rhizobium leguminosarum]
MNDAVPATVFDDDMIEILPPERNAFGAAEVSVCDCCGRCAVMDEDCCGPCEECLSP